LYIGARDAEGDDLAFLRTADSGWYPLHTHLPNALSDSLITNYLMRPIERFMPLARQGRLIDALAEPSTNGKSRSRLGVDFGSVGLCHVAAGFTDGMVEFAKGFAIWDLSPGHYILHAAGGVVLDLEGSPMSLDYGLGSVEDIARAMGGRRKFVADGSAQTAQEIL